MKRILNVILVIMFALPMAAQKPAVWIITDMSDKTIPGDNKEGTLNDPDDISAMAGYLILANEFNTRAITVSSTHRIELANFGNQAEWCVDYFGKAYKHDVKYMSKKYADYPKGLCLYTNKRAISKGFIPVYESVLKNTAERYNPNQTYNVAKYCTVKAIYNELQRTENGQPVYSENYPLNILCWGSVTEPAILVNYCIAQGEMDVLKRMRLIAHWTNSPLHQGTVECPECVANCREDAKACAYLKAKAYESVISYYECGAIGQHGIVSGSQKGDAYYEQFHVSKLGEIFATGKYVFKGVDDSDCATYYVLLGKWGVTLNHILPNGSNTAEREFANEKLFKSEAMNIRNELLSRCKLAK